MQLTFIGALMLATGSFVAADVAMPSTPSTPIDPILAVASPTWLPNFPKPPNVNTGYLSKPIDTITPLSRTTLNLTAYPEPWTSPPTTHPEVVAVINSIDWSHVPNSTIHTGKSNGDLDLGNCGNSDDLTCWWSCSNCVNPKLSYLPPDISFCPRAGDWGLTYDDGPFNLGGSAIDDQFAEPVLYNFLAKTNQKATLFYIGSNVATYPAAAQRALNDGQVLCVHTWSHPQMTTQTNQQVVAEFYWTLRAIKEATGVTPRCWRPPYGDVDDRVRAIAWQMGLRTIIWDEDTNDWNLPGSGGGKLSFDTVDGYFQGWIDARKNGSDSATGHIVLEHELNNSTVSMTEKWLPQLQQVFNVVSVHACMNISQPYWEQNWVYPTEANNSTAPLLSSSALPTATSIISLAPSVQSTPAPTGANLSVNASSSQKNSGASTLALSATASILIFAASLSLL
ncbi:chitin deacetylase [Spinellus fusiger]|nr:chitin deacetylase [Spinellus fusiger]